MEIELTAETNLFTSLEGGLSAAFNPDGSRVVIVGGSGVARVWDFGTADPSPRFRVRDRVPRAQLPDPRLYTALAETRIVTAASDLRVRQTAIPPNSSRCRHRTPNWDFHTVTPR